MSERADFYRVAYPPGSSESLLKQGLAPAITKAASQQTYYTIRFLVDRERVTAAYRAYAYFRWVDDLLDAETGSSVERSAFIRRQGSILEAGYRGAARREVDIHERLLVDLIQDDTEPDSGLQCYLRNMLRVMAFDAERRGRLISQSELSIYSHWLASAVTEAMHYFIGHCCYSPQDEARYLAVTAAHITHMLRDTLDDVRAGYYNIPREVLELHGMPPQTVHHAGYRAWVRSRVQLARAYFKRGRHYLSQVESFRCRLAGYLYTARFEWLLDTIEREDYLLRPQYAERKSFGVGLRMALDTLSAMAHGRKAGVSPTPSSIQNNTE